jgi:xylulokinase
MDLLIGIDVGTTHLKAAAFTPAGEQVAIAHVPTPTNRLEGGGAEYDPDALWAGIAQCLRQVREAAPGNVTAVGIASMAEAGVLVGESGRPVYPAIAWFDPRTRLQAEALSANPGRDALYLRTGLFVMAKHGLAKLLWLKEHLGGLPRQSTWLSMAEWIGFCLTGERASCPTLAARTLAYDLTKGEWATDLLAAVGLSPEHFAPLIPEGSVLGRLSKAAADLTGLAEGTPVTLAGHDHPCASLAAGITGPGQMLDSTGTAEAVIGAIPTPVLTPAAIASQISQGPLPVPGLFGLQAGAAAAGGSLEWFKREFFPGATYADITAAAEGAGDGPSGLLYLPHLNGGGPPAVDPASRGAVIGLTSGSTRGHVARAVLEGTCFELRRMVEAMERLVGRRFEAVTVTGGHAHNPLWLQLKADILGRTVVVPDVAEATLLGAAMLAGVAGGAFSDQSAAAAGAHRSVRQIAPRAEIAAAYERFYPTYERLASSLAPLYQNWPPSE